MNMRAAVIMVLTFVFGIVPATLLVQWAVVLGAVGVTALFLVGHLESALMGLLLIAVSVLAVFGCAALFFAAGDAVTPKVAWWLGGGVVANVIGIGILAGQMTWSASGEWFLLAAPLIVGCAHLIRYAARARKRRTSEG